MKIVSVAVFALLFAVPGYAKDADQSGIKRSIIENSIAQYPGNCPCPYSSARNGSRCGKRSAYSRPGGASPICYPEDVTPQMIQQYRNGHKL